MKTTISFSVSYNELKAAEKLANDANSINKVLAQYGLGSFDKVKLGLGGKVRRTGTFKFGEWKAEVSKKTGMKVDIAIDIPEDVTVSLADLYSEAFRLTTPIITSFFGGMAGVIPLLDEKAKKLKKALDNA